MEANKVADQLITKGTVCLDEHFVVLLKPPFDVLLMLKFIYIHQSELKTVFILMVELQLIKRMLIFFFVCLYLLKVHFHLYSIEVQ